MICIGCCDILYLILFCSRPPDTCRTLVAAQVTFYILVFCGALSSSPFWVSLMSLSSPVFYPFALSLCLSLAVFVFHLLAHGLNSRQWRRKGRVGTWQWLGQAFSLHLAFDLQIFDQHCPLPILFFVFATALCGLPLPLSHCRTK